MKSSPKRLNKIRRVHWDKQIGSYKTIAEAVEACKPGDKISLGHGRYCENLILEKDIDIVGEGDVKKIVIETGSTNDFPQSVLSIRGRCSLSNVTVMAAEDRWGLSQTIAVNENAFCDITGCEIIGGLFVMGIVFCTSSSFNGGSVLISGESALLRGEKIKFSDGEGVNLQLGANVELIDCVVSRQGKAGIMISDSSHIIAKKCIITGNEIGFWANLGSSGLFEECDFRGNDRGTAVRVSGSKIMGRNNLND